MCPKVLPVRLRNRGYGLYSWSNGADVLSVQRLGANVFRTPGPGRKSWTVRFFAGTHAKSVWETDNVWSLRMVRVLVALVADRYEPDWRKDWWTLRDYVKELTRAAWLEAADAEIAHLSGEEV